MYSSPENLVRVGLELNYPAAWLDEPAQDGLGGTNADGAVRQLIRVVRGRRVVPSSTWFKQAACYVCYRPPRLSAPLEVPVLLIGNDERLHYDSFSRIDELIDGQLTHD